MSRPATWSLVILFPAVLAGGCAGPDRADRAARVDTLASGRIQVTNRRGGTWTPGSAWRLEEDLRLGSVEGSGPELFSQVAAILTDEEDRIWVLDYPSQEIRVFSPSGEFLHRMGGEGEGPGELTGAAGLDWGPEGRLWVWGSSRYVVLDRSGEEVARYPRAVRGVIYSWMGGFDDRGRYLDWGLDRERSATRQEGQFLISTYTGRTMFHPVLFRPPARYDTLPMLEFRAQVTEEGQLKQGSKGIEASQRDGAIWFAHTDDYTVYRRTLEGDTTLAFTLPARPMPVPDREIDSVLAVWAERDYPGPRLTRDGFVLHRPVVGNVRTDAAGRVWVFPQEEGLPEGAAVDVFEESGVYLGRMTFPETILTERPSPHITDDHLYAVVVDELEVPFVVRYRIVRPG